MGATVPLGYQVKDRELLIKEPEAGFVRGLFTRYLELKSVPAVQRRSQGPRDCQLIAEHRTHGLGS